MDDLFIYFFISSTCILTKNKTINVFIFLVTQLIGTDTTGRSRGVSPSKAAQFIYIYIH